MGKIKYSSCIQFDVAKFANPDSFWWPAYFWIWNGPLAPEVLTEQLRDMYAHDVRSVCALPEPRQFEPQNHCSQMDVEYLSPDFFDRVRMAVIETSRLGMNYWLYDEGGWPSGNACGQVLAGRADLAACVLQFEEDGRWKRRMVPAFKSLEQAGTSMRYPDTDLLNPETLQIFVELTHVPYAEAVGDYFGSTIRFAFTDEPAFRQIRPGYEIPWTTGLEKDFSEHFGYRIEDKLDTFLKNPSSGLTRNDMLVRADFFDWCSMRLRSSYFKPLREWCRTHGLFSGGHLAGDDDTLGAVNHGFGHVLRMLREMDVPGIDVISRQIFPGQVNPNFPKFAASAAHQTGTPFALSESFALYGNGLTIEQAKWIVDYQYVRGITLLIMAAYPLSTRNHLMAGLRPHFGPVNPLWDYMPIFHRYVARLGYALACGKPAAKTAVYYPVRDIWAQGEKTKAADACEIIVQKLLERQCEFDLIDDDILTNNETYLEQGQCRVSSMRYEYIIVGPCEWMAPEAAERLCKFVASGGNLLCVDGLPGIDKERAWNLLNPRHKIMKRSVYLSLDEAIDRIPPLLRLAPASNTIRVTARQLDEGAIYFLFNESESSYKGFAYIQEILPVKELDAVTGEPIPLFHAYHENDYTVVPLNLLPGASLLLLFNPFDVPGKPRWRPDQSSEIKLSDGWEVKLLRRFDSGETDYEIHTIKDDSWIPVELGSWAGVFGTDFSGDVIYRTSVTLPEAWLGRAIRLELGKVEYAARVCVNGREAGRLVWSPWAIDLPPFGLTERLEFEITITNTLANVLVSKKTARWPIQWANPNGQGWPGQFHDECRRNEMDGCGGGLYGPVRLSVGRK